MEKFFNKTHSSSERNSESGDRKMTADQNNATDLLSQLRHAAAKNNQNKPIETPTSSEQLWDPYFSRNSTYSISDISMSNRIANGKTLQGWKVVDKRRIYTTYRNGKLVQGEGAEGFKLSMGDAPITKGKKRGSTEMSKPEKTSETTNANRQQNITNFNTSDVSKKVKDCHYQENVQDRYQENIQNTTSNGEFDFCFS